MTYKFNKDQHIHELDGKPLYGITSVLGVIAKPALIQWSANEAVKYVKESKVWRLVPDTPRMIMISDKELEELLEEARTAHTRKKEKAGDWGSELHEKLEMLVKDAIQNTGGIIEVNEAEDKSIQNFLDWAKGKRFIESEKNLYSEKHWIGGIVDLVFEHEGKIFVGDIKTSSGIYPEMFLQCAGYQIMLEEMGHKIDGYEIVNLKKNGQIETSRSYGTERNKEAFLSALNLYVTLQDLKKENGKM